MKLWFQRKRKTNFERVGGTENVEFLTTLNVNVYKAHGFWWAEDNVRKTKSKHMTPEQAILALFWYTVEHEKDAVSHGPAH